MSPLHLGAGERKVVLKVLRACRLANLDKTVNSRFSEKPVSKNKVERHRGRQAMLLVSGLHIHTGKCIHKHAHIHVHSLLPQHTHTYTYHQVSTMFYFVTSTSFFFSKLTIHLPYCISQIIIHDSFLRLFICRHNKLLEFSLQMANLPFTDSA